MKKIIIMLADGFEEIEAVTSIDILRRAEIDVVTVSIKEDFKVKGAHDIEIYTDTKINILENLDKYDGIIIPGGMGGVENLLASDKCIKLIKDFYEKDKLVAAICAGPMVLEKADILKNKSAICYPGLERKLASANIVDKEVVIDENIITSKGPATAIPFAIEIVGYLLDENVKNNLRKDLLL